MSDISIFLSSSSKIIRDEKSKGRGKGRERTSESVIRTNSWVTERERERGGDRVRGGITVKLCKNIDSRSRRELLCEAWWSGLPATVCPLQTALRYYNQPYYNYAGETRVLTLDFISVHVKPRLRDGRCYLLMAVRVFIAPVR